MNQPTTPNTVEDFLPMPDLPYTAKRWGQSSIQVWSEDGVRDAQLAAILADRAQRPASPTVAGSVDADSIAHRIAERIVKFEARTHSGIFTLTKAVLDNSRLAPAAPSGEAVNRELLALLVESQYSIGGDWRERRDAAVSKALRAPSEIEAAVELPKMPQPDWEMADDLCRVPPTSFYNDYTLTSYATKAVLKDRANWRMK